MEGTINMSPKVQRLTGLERSQKFIIREIRIPVIGVSPRLFASSIIGEIMGA